MSGIGKQFYTVIAELRNDQTFLAGACPTMPCETARASKASSRPSPLICECAPIRSILVKSLISAFTLTSAMVPHKSTELKLRIVYVICAVIRLTSSVARAKVDDMTVGGTTLPYERTIQVGVTFGRSAMCLQKSTVSKRR